MLLQGQLTKYLSLAIIPSWCLRRTVFSSASGARNENSPAASQCVLYYCCCRWDRNAGSGWLCLYLSLTALPVVGSAAETLTCLCHAGIRFLRPHLLPCCFCKHFRVPVGRTDKHMDFADSSIEKCVFCLNERACSVYENNSYSLFVSVLITLVTPKSISEIGKHGNLATVS